MNLSLTIGSLCEWCLIITMKHSFMLFYHDEESADANISKSFNLSVHVL